MSDFTVFHRLTVYLNAPRWETDLLDYNPPPTPPQFFSGSTLIILKDTDRETERCSPPSSPPSSPPGETMETSEFQVERPVTHWSAASRDVLETPEKRLNSSVCPWRGRRTFTSPLCSCEQKMILLKWLHLFWGVSRSPPTAGHVCWEAGERQGSDVIKRRLWLDGPSGCSACRASVTFALFSVCAPPGPGRHSAGRLSTWLTSDLWGR